MQKQIEDLTNKIKQMKTQNKQSNESTEITEPEPQAALFTPQRLTPRKIQILQRGENVPILQTQKNLQNASAIDRGVTKEELKDIMSLIQNTMQALTAFKKRFNGQKNI